MPLPAAINHAHTAAPDLLQDFVITEMPVLVRDVDFSENAFKSRARYLANSFQALTQEAADANSSVESRGGAALLAFSRAFGHSRRRVREPVRIVHERVTRFRRQGLHTGGGSRLPRRPDSRRCARLH